MGAVTFSLDIRLVECLKEVLPLSVFVETGTFKGDTIANLAQHFDKLITIEFSEQLWKDAVARFENVRNVEAHLGNSPVVLAMLRPGLVNTPSLFWLDAHWCVAKNTAGNHSQCPLLGEILAINKLNGASVVLIDDARLFLAPPPDPHDISQWPSFDQIVTALHNLSDQHELMIVNDVIAFYPQHARESITEYARKYGVDWLAVSPYLDPKNNLIQTLEEKEQVIQSQHALLQQQQKEIAEKQHLIEEMRAYLFVFYPILRLIMWIARPAYRTLKPRLGNLYQHPPHKLHLPAPYFKTAPLTGTPKISIVTPSFQQAAFIERTIKSVLDQSYPNLEYLVQDGGSTDATVAVLKRYADRLTGWESRTDSGQSQAINLGFAKTTGEIMAWLNSDDMLPPGALACVAEYFNRHPEVDVVYGHRILIDENDQEIGRWMMPAHDDGVLSWADYIPQETMFWRRRIWEKAGGKIDESFRFAMDWDLLLRFRDTGARFARLPRFLGEFRIHPHQKTSAAISEIGFHEMSLIRQRALGRSPSKAEIRRAVLPYLLKHVATDLWWRIRNKLRLGRNG
ncbi:MAG: glycosyltransferase family 2 protein [Gallionella sp.]